ncbi:hypothetical protein OG352_39795 (plasmid) [Streptomyces sp. NBC_01485]|uniref:hypothetical protein n=1 Tax=Streptomyces sp. NBC_01485 TaxID=2903884 RepID=UPI002E301CCB|nr:hypothetical protein [Streptomyces sp. NBC_01485]
MALSDRPAISIAPGTRPDPQFETTYQASRGGSFPPANQPAPGSGDSTADGRNSGLNGGQSK